MGSPAIRSVKGLVAVVTGGSSGLGRGVVERLVRQEARVLILDLPSSNGAEVAKGLGSEDCVAFHASDVSSESAKAAISDVVKRYGRLDALVNCAGIAIARQTFNFNKGTYHDLAEFNKCIQVNVCGTFNMIRLAASAFGRNEPNEDGHRGVVVNTSSVAAFDGQQGQAAYSASKGAIVSMTLPIARDFSRQGIRVVTVAPGMAQQSIVDYFVREKCASKPEEFPGTPPNRKRKIEEDQNSPRSSKISKLMPRKMEQSIIDAGTV